MQFLFLVLSFLNLGVFANVKIEDFENNIHQGYEEYEIIVNENNQYYSLKIAWGVNNNNVNYSIYFYNETPKALNLHLIVDNKFYTLPTDSRKDVAVEAFRPASRETLQVVITDNFGHSYRTIELPMGSNKEDFLLKSQNTLIGLNNGIKTTALKRYRQVQSYSLIIFVLFTIIVLSISTIIVLFLTKKGVFNKENQLTINYYIPSSEYQFNQDHDDIIELDNEDIAEFRSDEEEKTVYRRMKHYDDEQNFDFDVIAYLQNKGFITNYKILAEEEKNLIMLELMKMRDEKIISIDQYDHEVIKLWS